MKTITTEKHHTTCSALISIVMPTYNRAHYISRCIESILTQSYTNWELWVIDDGSTDETSQKMSVSICMHKKTKAHLPLEKLAYDYQKGPASPLLTLTTT